MKKMFERAIELLADWDSSLREGGFPDDVAEILSDLNSPLPDEEPNPEVIEEMFELMAKKDHAPLERGEDGKVIFSAVRSSSYVRVFTARRDPSCLSFAFGFAPFHYRVYCFKSIVFGVRCFDMDCCVLFNCELSEVFLKDEGWAFVPEVDETSRDLFSGRDAEALYCAFVMASLRKHVAERKQEREKVDAERKQIREEQEILSAYRKSGKTFEEVMSFLTSVSA